MPLLLIPIVGLTGLGAGFFGGLSASDKLGSALKIAALAFAIFLMIEFTRRARK